MFGRNLAGSIRNRECDVTRAFRIAVVVALGLFTTGCDKCGNWAVGKACSSGKLPG